MKIYDVWSTVPKKGEGEFWRLEFVQSSLLILLHSQIYSKPLFSHPLSANMFGKSENALWDGKAVSSCSMFCHVDQILSKLSMTPPWLILNRHHEGLKNQSDGFDFIHCIAVVPNNMTRKFEWHMSKQNEAVTVTGGRSWAFTNSEFQIFFMIFHSFIHINLIAYFEFIFIYEIL